jgi:hypothetical protein
MWADVNMWVEVVEGQDAEIGWGWGLLASGGRF